MTASMEKKIRALGMLCSVSVAVVILTVSWFILMDTNDNNAGRGPDGNPYSGYVGQYALYDISAASGGASLVSGTVRFDVTDSSSSSVTVKYTYRLSAFIFSLGSGTGYYDAYPNVSSGASLIYMHDETVRTINGNKALKVYSDDPANPTVTAWVGDNGVIYKANISLSADGGNTGAYDITLTLKSMKGTDIFGLLNIF